eukprot:7389116-Prymnesium_polylepis.2
MSSVISGVVAGLPWDIRNYFGHPYALQLLGLVFGYLSVARLNESYNRCAPFVSPSPLIFLAER